LSRPEAVGETARVDAVPSLPRDACGPVFAEPWQAQAFALAVKLSERGHFTWKEWAGTLADQLKAASDRGEPDDGSHYYHHWLAALERLVTIKGLTDWPALDARKESWVEAYRHTPHGKPVELASGCVASRVCPFVPYWPSTSIRCAAAVFPQPEVDPTRSWTSRKRRS
jgi:nitrile hydratase accessory protein